MARPDALELAGQVAGDLGRGVVDGPCPAAMPGAGPGLPQPGGALAGQLDLDRHPLGQRVDVLAVQARRRPRGRGRRGAGRRRRGRGSCRPRGAAPAPDSQRPPAGMLGSRASRTTPTAWTWASWGMTKDQARTSRPTSRRALAVGATHRCPRRRSRATRPRSSQRSSTSRRVVSPSWPSTRGEPGDSRPSRTRRTSERAAYCWPSQRRAATSRSVMPASVSQRGRRDDPGARSTSARSGPGPWTCGPGRVRPARKRPSSGT